MQIEYSSNFVKVLTSTAAHQGLVHLMQNLHLRGGPHQHFCTDR